MSRKIRIGWMTLSLTVSCRDDIAGFQNRLGVFFFTLALFGFSCLSSLGLFANERILFMRERANGYYSSFTYFSSKVCAAFLIPAYFC